MSDRASSSRRSTSEAASGIVVPELPELEGDEKHVAQRLAMSFATLMVGQTLASESDYPYDPFWIELSPQTRLTRRVFCSLLGLKPSREMLMGPPSRPVPPGEPGSEVDLEYVLFSILLINMRAVLGDLTEVLARAEGVVEVPYFLFGRLKTGALVGVRSIAIET
jgi:hypothetical protein